MLNQLAQSIETTNPAGAAYLSILARDLHLPATSTSTSTQAPSSSPGFNFLLLLIPLLALAVLVNNHGPFTWGKDAAAAVLNSVVLEEIAKTTYRSLHLNPETTMDTILLDKHFLRKHGKNAYYGQS
jgi:ribulose-5-phosphate 4-epimerase/fuculose-1-phosphate aldolase